ncbi:winged helix-turn-helix domain-containing protein [Desulfocurvus vexinensis]|uniref:winged helix-turn-helix domain-containing protein n=1 Tax=Desulfocurvus vexinensis TaxID=399548 RepID=UPI000491536D|nr:winged helix-turn-helix domain-containing protein [Desulfocurvus vexinensis]
MLPHQGRFVRPSTAQRTLTLLEALAEAPDLSQSVLGERAGLSPAMVNTYLRDFQTQGLVEARPVNGKSFRYELTPRGEGERRALLGDYCAEIVRSYTAIKALVRAKLARLETAGHTRLALWGASETCEVVLAALGATGLTVLALLDSDPAKHGTVLGGHPILPPEVLPGLRCDAVVITSFGRGDDIEARLRAMPGAAGVEVVRL